MREIIRLESVRQVYSGRTVLDIEHMEIEPGEIIGLTGPNGAGKSVLLRLLAFLEAPAQGSVLFQGKPAPITPNQVHRQVTLLVQEPYLLKRSVFANVAYGLKVRRESNIQARVHEAMVKVGLPPETFAGRHWFELSGGETQRVALAARLVLKPKILLMDEPTASLDRASATLISQAALDARNEDGTTLVIASHDIPWLNTVSTRTFHVERGRMLLKNA